MCRSPVRSRSLPGRLGDKPPAPAGAPQPAQGVHPDPLLVEIGLSPTLGRIPWDIGELEVEHRMTTTSGSAATMRRVASIPSMPGILRSMSTSPGWRSPARVTASSPLTASPINSKPSRCWSTARAARRNGA